MDKILMLLQAPFPPDIRVEREIKTLSENGYKVGIICNQYQKDFTPDFPKCQIFRIKAYFKSNRLNKTINFPLFLNPLFIFKAITVYFRFRPDVIHAHDLPMAPLGILVGKLFRIPIIFDMHESYPDALVAFKKKGLLNRIFKNPQMAKILENYCLKKVDNIIVVVDEHKDKLIARGIPKRKISVVLNSVDLNIFNQLPSDDKIKNKYHNNFVLLYSGGVSPDRGLEIPIKSLSLLKDKIPNITLLIIGDGAYVKKLKELAILENVENFIQFIKWPGHYKLGSYLDLANIFIIPQPSNDYINSGIPNKFFEYMSQGKPILAASIPMERIMKEVKCGLVFNSGSAVDFAQKILNIVNSDVPFGENGMKAVEEKYNWENESKILLKIYSNLDFE